MTFASLALHEKLQLALTEAGYENPTPVQAESIPSVLAGRDLIVSAQTGTGKTAAFMLPALSRIADDPRKVGRGPRILVLTPTRELAQQVTAAAQKYGSQLKGMRTISVLGGMPFPAQNRLLERPYDILVATPGRLLDHMQRGRITFDRLDMMILDEADRMLDMGFIEDVELIASKTPPERQTLLFSATFEPRIARLAESLLKDPKRIEIASQTMRNENIEQKVYFTDDLEHKKKLLLHMLTSTDIQQAIVFAGTRADSEALADELSEFGHSVDALHGDMKQSARNRTLNGLRHGRIRVLVATDVAARGIDVPGISHVINYDLPKNAEDYVHRIGRTGRAGRSGIACSLVGPRDRGVLRRIEQFTDHRIDVAEIEGLEPQRRMDQDRPRRGKPAGDKPRWGHKDRQARTGSNASNSRHAPRGDRNDRGDRQQEQGRRADRGNSSNSSNRRDDNFGNRADSDNFGNRDRFSPSASPWQSQGNGQGQGQGRRNDRQNAGGRRQGGAGFRGGYDSGFNSRETTGSGGFRGGYNRDERLDTSAANAAQVAVSYARPRRQGEGRSNAPTAAVRRPRQDKMFDDIGY